MATYVAMWSGPRNISTAMMRAWENRPDTAVCDEPLYAHYLLATGHTDHPGYDETIHQHETDWRKVVKWLTEPVPDGKTVFYQKHMAHHLLPEMEVDWTDGLVNCFLIRDPREVLLSLAEFLPAPSVEQTGLPQQLQLFERVHGRTGRPPAVLDARDVLEAPREMLESLCRVTGVPFENSMLNWPPGPRATDGAWAPHWYGKVYETTSFGTYHPREEALPEQLLGVWEMCQPLYEMLYSQRIVPATTAKSHASKV